KEAELEIAFDPVDRVAVHPGQLMDVNAVIGPAAEPDPDLAEEDEGPARPGKGARRIEAGQGRQARLEDVRTSMDPDVVPDGMSWAGCLRRGHNDEEVVDLEPGRALLDRVASVETAKVTRLDINLLERLEQVAEPAVSGDRPVADALGRIRLELNRHAPTPVRIERPTDGPLRPWLAYRIGRAVRTSKQGCGATRHRRPSQYGGQGMAGRSGSGCGNRPPAISPSSRSRVAVTSSGSRSAPRRRPSRPSSSLRRASR